jgi:hypothetical protein
MCRRLGIGGECSTEVGWKSDTEMCEMAGESTDGVGMRYQLEVAGRLVEDRVDRLLRMMRGALTTESGGSGEPFR